MTRRSAGVCAGFMFLTLLTVSCGRSEPVLRVAEQFGLAYAPVSVAKELGFIEEELETAGLPPEVGWLKLGNTASIREAAAAGRVDAAFMGIPPFIISRNGGMEWRIAAGLSRSPLALVSWRSDLRVLEDFGPEDRIALPQPGSIQHILLAMAAEKRMGDAGYFDRRLVTMNHPDGMRALSARKEIAAHFTAPPYLFMELGEPGMHEIIGGEECFGGPFTFIVTVATEQLREERPEAYRAFIAGIERGMNYVRDNPGKCAELLAPVYGMEAHLIETMLTHPGMVFEEEVYGVDTFVSFMKRAGYLPHSFDPLESFFREEGL